MAITKDMFISDIVKENPATAMIFMEYGMGCLGCSAARHETIEQGAIVHGIDVDALVEALNKASK